ncbi:MAG: bifunctional diguanylate cyclase/phosphodiesterase [Steroidobacteraceae bacterium]
MGQRLEHCTRETDLISRANVRDPATLARLGGDEFTVLLPALILMEAVEDAAQRIILAISKPVALAGHDLVVTPSIGIAMFPEDGTTAELLLANADAALTQAKQQGGNRFAFYSKALNTKSMARLTLGNQLRRALERGEFLLYYQPKVSLTTGRIEGAEALIRWELPGEGLVPPGRFIALAEELGLIVPMGEWAIREVCAQQLRWRRDGLASLAVAVNVSYVQFVDRAIVRAVERALDEFPLPESSLIVELTESILMTNTGTTLQSVNDLRALGVLLSIDDFGTGYSSLAYLKHLPVNELKIDRSFLAEVPHARANVAIIKAIVTLARNLGLKVVAEGVEAREQLEFLHTVACDQYQGHLCSPAVPRGAFEKLVRSVNMERDVLPGPRLAGTPMPEF